MQPNRNRVWLMVALAFAVLIIVAVLLAFVSWPLPCCDCRYDEQNVLRCQ